MHLNVASRSECPLRRIKHWTCRWSHCGTSVDDAVCFLIEQRRFGPDRVPWDVRRTCENPSSCSPCWYVPHGVFPVWKRDPWAGRVEGRDWWMWVFFKDCEEELRNKYRFALAAKGEVWCTRWRRSVWWLNYFLCSFAGISAIRAFHPWS